MRKYKHHILHIVVIVMLFSLITINHSNISSNSNNVSALSYSSSVGVGFTFNPTLSVSLSSSDLVISNLVPGSTLDSNVINVSVASNASYGYTLSAMMNGNNSDLVHTNNSTNNGNSNVFSSIATNADLSSLDNSEDTNIWGYSYKDNTVVSPTWSNYNGLSSSNSTVLLDTNSNNSNIEANGIDSIDFKIGAKASNTQASGTYTGVINFTAVSKPTPMNLSEAYFAAGKTRHNGCYAMQDMTSEICDNTEVVGEGSQTQLIDIRDDKVYWATKLADGHCWMTQNLDLDLDSSRTYTHYDTDLGWTVIDENEVWRPDRSTVNFTIGSNVSGWQESNTRPFSANPGDVYFRTTNFEDDGTQYNALQECISAGYNDCLHYHIGNYYNWSAAVANNDTSSFTSNTISDIRNNPKNSVCPSGWRLPTVSKDAADKINSTNEFARLVLLYNKNSLIAYPVYFVYSGAIVYFNNYYLGSWGQYQSSTTYTNALAYKLSFKKSAFYPTDNEPRSRGFVVRCLAR